MCDEQTMSEVVWCVAESHDEGTMTSLFSFSRSLFLRMYSPTRPSCPCPFSSVRAGISWSELNRSGGYTLSELLPHGCPLVKGTRVSTEHGEGEVEDALPAITAVGPITPDGPRPFLGNKPAKVRVRVRSGFSAGAVFAFDLDRLRLV